MPRKKGLARESRRRMNCAHATLDFEDHAAKVRLSLYVRRLRRVSMKRTLKWIALTAALILFVAFVVLSYAQPLLLSRAYTVTATLDGAPIRAELLRPPAIPGTYYLHLPEAQPKRYSWFGIAFSRHSVFSPVALYFASGGTPYIHTDQAKGVRLTDGKIEDDWKVAFTSDGVQFSNVSLSVTLKRNR